MADAEHDQREHQSEPTESTKGTRSDPQDTGATSASGDAPREKTYTQAEFDAMVTARLSKHEKALRKQMEEEQAEARRKAEQTAEERAAEAERKLEEAMKKVEEREMLATLRMNLAGKVRDVDYAIFKASQGGDFVNEDGSIQVDRYLKAFPDQAVAQPGPAPTKAGGRGPTDKLDMDQVVRDMIQSRR